MSQAPSPSPDALPADVEALLAPLVGLEERPVAEHVAAFDEVHAGVRRVLAGEDLQS